MPVLIHGPRRLRRTLSEGMITDTSLLLYIKNSQEVRKIKHTVFNTGRHSKPHGGTTEERGGTMALEVEGRK